MTALRIGLRRPLQITGIVRTAHTEPAATPIQVGLNRAEHTTLEIANRYREGPYGLADFDYTWLHRPRVQIAQICAPPSSWLQAAVSAQIGGYRVSADSR